EAPLVAVGQRTRHIVGAMPDAHVLEQLVRPGFDVGFFRPGGPVARDGAIDPSPRTNVATDHYVLDGAQAAEQTKVLERACEPDDRDFMRLQSRKLMPHEIAAAGFGHVQAGQYVEES